MTYENAEQALADFNYSLKAKTLVQEPIRFRGRLQRYFTTMEAQLRTSRDEANRILTSATHMSQVPEATGVSIDLGGAGLRMQDCIRTCKSIVYVCD